MYTEGNAEERKSFEQDLLASLQAHGFAKLINYGMHKEYVDTLMMWCRSFFTLNQSTKDKIRNQKGPKPQRGFSGVGDENLDTFALDGTESSWIDVKEHLDLGPRNDTMFPNQWPPETQANGLIGFRRFMESYFDVASNLSRQLLSILEDALEVNHGTLTKLCDRHDNELRLNHYPAISVEDITSGRVRRSGAHTDFGTLTLLFQDNSGGLQIEDRSSKSPQVKFVSVDAKDPYQLVINVADTLQRWTNDIIPAGLHQVTLPESSQGDDRGMLKDRFSVVFFQKGNRDESVGSMPDFVSEKKPARYEHLSAIEYHKRRHTVIYG
ncbi:uncharacterized protein KY384_007311 [Bacidia gigantensis]|uniref:uncharacterized protein n=1 Tax=Bacidia gigantensis TaxID=2732470 RepID=UPI001D0365D5|nr:uncharacterized protein KY384_007311 [Bacidia gigantensis]KAG8528393.1 hypothetical protein KY384_007311 [Bacidia gigantensis]